MVTDTPNAITTIGELIEFYVEHHVRYLKSARGRLQLLRRHLAPLAALPLAGLTKRMVVEWHAEIGRTRGKDAANNALMSLHALYEKGTEWELHEGKNPAHGVRKFPKVSRHRFVQPIEMLYLRKALDEELPRTQVYFLCLLMTGCRRDEARLMQWAHLDLVQKLWHKPTSKNGLPHTVPLPDLLVERIRQLPQVHAHVFTSEPNNKNGQTRGLWCGTAVEYHWRRIRKRAGLVDVHIHDLRRSTASWMACAGENLPVIQQMLNHSSLAVTQVYARLSVEPVRRALNANAERMFGEGPPAAPMSLPHSLVHVSTRSDEPEWPG